MQIKIPAFLMSVGALSIVVVALALPVSKKTEEKVFTYRLNQQQSEIVIEGLSKIPYEKAAPLINEIVRQYNHQLIDTNKIAPPKKN